VEPRSRGCPGRSSLQLPTTGRFPPPEFGTPWRMSRCARPTATMGTFANHARAMAVVAVLLALRVTARDLLCNCHNGRSYVCGSNGVSYINYCWATDCANVAVACWGKCPCGSNASGRKLFGDLPTDSTEPCLCTADPVKGGGECPCPKAV